MFCVRDGPINYYFCDTEHAEYWLEYRHKVPTYELCRMLPQQRMVELQGRSMEEEISRLLNDEVTADCNSTPGLRDIHSR